MDLIVYVSRLEMFNTPEDKIHIYIWGFYTTWLHSLLFIKYGTGKVTSSGVRLFMGHQELIFPVIGQLESFNLSHIENVEQKWQALRLTIC